jgi:hypothetical protein
MNKKTFISIAIALFFSIFYINNKINTNEIKEFKNTLFNVNNITLLKTDNNEFYFKKKSNY